jgi:hypothetical protein
MGLENSMVNAYHGEHRHVHDFESSDTVNLLSPLSYLYVYSDLINTSHMGNIQANILALTGITSHYGDMINLEFVNPEYHIVNKSRISEISIQITDMLGRDFHFVQSECVIKLHLKRSDSYLRHDQ